MENKANKEGAAVTQVSIQEPDEFVLYERPPKIYPAKVKGHFRRLKWLFMIVLLGAYYLLPWVRWDRGEGTPDQAILVDILNRKFYFFFIELWPQEVFYFTGLLMLAALGLFFATTLFGRVWCGYACPQTVWTDLFVAVERWIEGDRNARLKLDKGPLTFNKIRKKITKHTLWILIGLCTGGAWIFYFNDAPTTWAQFLQGDFHFVPTFWLIFLTCSTYIMAGWAREQVCTYVCPYARFQGAMFDEESLIVSYDEKRGEPRGKGGKGDCVDCLRCVAVCPMGIDIREGQQYQCINCALCVDACNSVMDKLGKDRGLIRYNTLNNTVPSGTFRLWHLPKHVRFIRFRTTLYFTIISAIGSTMLYALATRSLIDLNVVRHRNPLYVTLADGSARNTYTLHVINKTWKNETYTLSLKGLPTAKLSMYGQKASAQNTLILPVTGNKVGSFKVFVDVPPTAFHKDEESVPATFIIKNAEQKDTYKTIILLPEKPSLE